MKTPRLMNYVMEPRKIKDSMAMPITIPNHLIIGEPELKWCEAICDELIAAYRKLGNRATPPRDQFKWMLLHKTNMSEIRVDRALNLLYHMKRI